MKLKHSIQKVLGKIFRNFVFNLQGGEPFQDDEQWYVPVSMKVSHVDRS